MNTTTETMHHHLTRETALKWAATGSGMESIEAVATIALAIVGLAGVFSTAMAAIATIVIGVAILTESGAISSAQLGEVAGVERADRGPSAEVLGRMAGTVLGILPRVGVVPLTLLSVGLIVFGAAFLLSGNPVFQAGYGAAGSGGRALAGLGGLVLGILAVIGEAPLTLVLAGLLSLGATALFSGSVFGLRAAAEGREYPAPSSSAT